MTTTVEAGAAPADKYIAALDIGTTSIRCMIFRASDLRTVASCAQPLATHHPKPGWVEQDPVEYVTTSVACILGALHALRQLPGHANRTIACLGITNQRETAIAWDRVTMIPFARAIVWSDHRTQPTVERYQRQYRDDAEFFRSRTGLPFSTYFSSYKFSWMLEHIPELQRQVTERPTSVALGTIDAWITFVLTDGQHFVTDCTNASRTNLMNLETCAWDPALCAAFNIPITVLPRIVTNGCGVIGSVRASTLVPDALAGIPITALLGDQHAALVGQLCFEAGSVKCTYGTGCFVLRNVGHTVPDAREAARMGVVRTVAYQFGSQPVYALEGSVGVAGSLISWLIQNLNMVATPQDATSLARSAGDSEDVYFVPAFSGLYCPWWDADARGMLIGLTQHTRKEHIVRAALESICFQVCDVLAAMDAAHAAHARPLCVDGGITSSTLVMQLQADYLEREIHVAPMLETTALGAAIAAGLSSGCWNADLEVVKRVYDRTGGPMYAPDPTTRTRREQQYTRWKAAVQRSRGWAKL